MAKLKKRGAIFISGWGSNLQVFLDNKEKFEQLVVVSSSVEAYGLKRAEENGVDSIILGQPIDWKALNQSLDEKQIDFIFCAGFMKIIPSSFIKTWEGRIFNLHPSLLPKFKGLRAIERAFEVSDAIGVSIHHLVAEVDSGEVVLQETAFEKESYSGLSIEEVSQQVQSVEHQLVKQWIESQTLSQ